MKHLKVAEIRGGGRFRALSALMLLANAPKIEIGEPKGKIIERRIELRQ